jgi:hypothetical protein
MFNPTEKLELNLNFLFKVQWKIWILIKNIIAPKWIYVLSMAILACESVCKYKCNLFQCDLFYGPVSLPSITWRSLVNTCVIYQRREWRMTHSFIIIASCGLQPCQAQLKKLERIFLFYTVDFIFAFNQMAVNVTILSLKTLFLLDL